MDKKATIVIPSRYGSKRFPGKPLALLKDKPLIQWVVEAANKVENADNVVVATDHDEIANIAASAGAQIAMTGNLCRTGSDRVWEAVKILNIKSDLIVNLQGDEPMIRPSDLEMAIDAVVRNEAPISTLYSDLKSIEEFKVIVVFYFFI